MSAAVQAAKDVGGRTALSAQARKELRPMLAHLAVGANGLDGVGKARLKLRATSVTDESASVAATRKPTPPLPTRKPRCPKRHLLDHCWRHLLRLVVTADTRRVRELSVKLRMSRTVGDAPRANALRQLFNAIDRAGVDKAALLTTALALRVRTLDAPCRNRVRVVFEGRQTHGA